jgi:hypothetical protein
MPALDLRPLSLGELLDRTFLLYRKHFLLFAGIAAIPYAILAALVSALVLLSRFAGPARSVAPGRMPISPWAVGAAGGGFFLAGIIFCALFLVSAGAAVIAVSEIYIGRPARIWGAIRAALKRIWSLLGILFLGLLIVAAGFILLVIPGIYFGCRMSVAFAAALVDEIGPVEAIKRSFALTKGFAGRAFMIFFLTVAISWAVIGLFQVPFMILIAASAKNPALAVLWVVLMEIANLSGSVLVAPIGTIGFVLLYYDLRVRKEAFDLHMMIQAIGDDSTLSPATGDVAPMPGRDAS